MVQILLELAQIPSSNDEIIHGFLMEDHLDQRKMPFFFPSKSSVRTFSCRIP
jgi:tRNA splicing ligase